MMSTSRMSDDDFYKQLSTMVEILVSAKDEHGELQQLVEQYKTQLTSEQLGELLVQAVTEDVDANTLCSYVVDLHDDGIYKALLDETFGSVFEKIPLEDRTYDVCLHAVSLDGMLLKDVPAQLIDEEMAEAAVEASGNALEYVPINLRSDVVCKKALKNPDAWEMIKFVPSDILTDAMIMAVVTNNYKAILHVPEDRRTKDMYLIAVRYNSFFIEQIPDKHYSIEICREAVNRNSLALAMVKSHLLERKEYLQLVNLALFNDPAVLMNMPRDFLTIEERQAIFDDDLCMSIVNNNGAYLAALSENERTREVCLVALKNNPAAFLSLNWGVFSEKEMKGIIRDVVERNPLLLEYVPEKFKAECINDLTVGYLLTRDFRCYQYMPKEYEKDIREYFSGIKHAAIYHYKDHELQDIYLVYANTGSRKEKIICVDDENVEEMLGVLKRYGASDLHLILIGHANKSSQSIADMSVSDITHFLQENKEFNRVTLMGCNTAKARVLDAELKIIDRFRLEHEGLSDCAFALMSEAPKNVGDLMKSLKQSSLYIFVNEGTADKPYTLYYFKRDSHDNDQFTKHQYHLSEVGYAILKNCLIAKGKNFKFPKNDTVIMLRGGNSHKSPDPLTMQELMTVQSASHNRERTNKSSPHYKQYKSVAVFLATVTVEGDEIHKLKNSLFQKLVTAIGESDINRNITVKGYARGLHVDTKENRLHVTRTRLYNKEYSSSFFRTNEETIDRAKLKGERSVMMGKFLGRKPAGKDRAIEKEDKDATKVKALKMKVTGKKE